MTYTINRKGRLENFESNLSDAEALEAIRESSSDFAKDLYAKRNRLSPKQMAWVHKLAIERRQPAILPGITAASVVAANSIDMTGVEALFANAEGSRLKRARITIDLGGTKIQLRKAGSRSRYAGQIQITDGGEFGNSKYYGRVENGNFVPGRDLDANVRTTLVDLAKDPVGYAQAYGHKSGNCCFCGLKLTDDRSVKAGYGEVCAGHWGLPWGGPKKRQRKPLAPAEPFVCPLPEQPVPKTDIAPWTTEDGVNFIVELSELQKPSKFQNRIPDGLIEGPFITFPSSAWEPSYLDDELVGWTCKRNGKHFSVFND